MQRALIEMAKQIAKLQEENDELKLQISKPARKEEIKVDPEVERFQRVTRWVATQYQRGFDEALRNEENKDRLAQIREDNPVFIPLNDCMDFWPSSNTN